MASSNKILIISHTYPPNPGVGGIRIKNLAKYIRMHGYETYILTSKLITEREDDENIIIETSEPQLNTSINTQSNRLKNFIKKYFDRHPKLHSFFILVRHFLNFPDKFYSWKEHAYLKAEEIIVDKDINIVISSAHPVVSHFVAAKLKKKYKIFWIAEFRDLWTYNHYFPNGISYTQLSSSVEKWLLRDVDQIVTISEPLAEKLRFLHKQKKVNVITNGFEPTILGKTQKDSKFTIIYTGILYEGKRDPTIFFHAINELIKEGLIDKNLISINFYGPYAEWLDRVINGFNLKDVVKQYGKIDRQLVLKHQRSAQLLLLLMYDHPSEVGVYTAKVFEYLNANRPILCLGSDKSVVADLLKTTNSGITTLRLQEVKDYLYSSYKIFLRDGLVPFNGDQNIINKYSYENLSKQYIKLFPEQ